LGADFGDIISTDNIIVNQWGNYVFSLLLLIFSDLVFYCFPEAQNYCLLELEKLWRNKTVLGSLNFVEILFSTTSIITIIINIARVLVLLLSMADADIRLGTTSPGASRHMARGRGKI